MIYRIIVGILLSTILIGCGEEQASIVEYETPNSVGKPFFYGEKEVPDMGKPGWQRFSHLFEQNTDYINKFELAILPDHYVKNWWPESSFGNEAKLVNNKDLDIKFYPLNQENTAGRFQYVHRYKCVYDPENYEYANIAYPNPCNPDSIAQARVIIKNTSSKAKTLYCRMFYQNTSYWHATNSNMSSKSKASLQNYYGGTDLAEVQLAPNEEKELFLDFVIGKDPKENSLETKKFYGPARSGAYEFMLWLNEDQTDDLLQPDIDYTSINPFAKAQKTFKRKSNSASMAFVPSNHFRFVTLNETFDGQNNMTPGEVYIVADRDNKRLCDTCENSYFRDIIKDNWLPEDYSAKGIIPNTPFVQGEYGNRKENVLIDTSGAYFCIPKSTPDHKQKTWGELKFAPGFLYGTVKVVAKLAQVRNTTKTPTGIIHNIWLYQRMHRDAFPLPGNPYGHLVNDKGTQPYEIDIEIWSKIYEECWKPYGFINYSIVDYMRDPGVKIKPGEEKQFEDGGLHTVDRSNNYQLNYPAQEDSLSIDFFDDYHLYEIRWTPHNVTYWVDDVQKAIVNWEMADIPDEYVFLWLGSLIYQDGTYYSQADIPFYETTRFSHIRYISIE
ncbi:MAG: family 16 glycosylhydrolase [Aureispira sp.]|nr:family 16 glycosylhydrolase [Aureispira sp.]